MSPPPYVRTLLPSNLSQALRAPLIPDMEEHQASPNPNQISTPNPAQRQSPPVSTSNYSSKPSSLKHHPGQNPWRWGVPHLLGLPQGVSLDPLPISKAPGPRQQEKGVGQLGLTVTLHHPFLQFLRHVRNIGLDCQSVTSCPGLPFSGRYRTLSSLPALFSAPHTPLHCV